MLASIVMPFLLLTVMMGIIAPAPIEDLSSPSRSFRYQYFNFAFQASAGTMICIKASRFDIYYIVARAAAFAYIANRYTPS